MSEELKPCPFCGGEAQVVRKPYEPKVCVGCGDDACLGFSGLGWLYETEEQAAAAWNRRAERTCRPEVCDDGAGAWGVYCSECGYRFAGPYGKREVPEHMAARRDIMPRYCPNCGAKVVGE